MDSLTSLVQAFVAHLDEGGGLSAAEFAAEHGTGDPDTAELLAVLAGLRERPAARDRLGPYRLQRELGRGAQGVVYLARDTRLDREVALKILSAEAAVGGDLTSLLRDLQVAGPTTSPRLLETAGALRRFRREVHAATRLDHPGICPVYEAGTADGSSFIAMRYVEGRSLAERIRAPGTREGVEAVCRLVEKIAEALHAAHEAGLIHRDVKPGNVMVGRDGEPVVLDFGLARDVDADLTQTGAQVGTPAYMSPEQITARTPVDRRTDVFALGVVLFECLAAQRPFDAPTVDSLYRQIVSSDPPRLCRLNPTVPPELQIVVDTALQKEPGQRYRTARDLADDLRRVRERRPIRAKAPGTLLRLRRWAERSPALAGSLGTILLLLVTGFVVMTGLWRQTRGALDDKSVALRRARALALANASAAALDTDATRALLLAREAARFERMPAVVSALHAALNRPLETHVIVAHEKSVTCVAYSPDGRRLLTGSEDRSACLRDRDGNPIAALRGHTDNVTAVAFSPAGDRLLTCSLDGTARLWDAEGKPVRVLRGHTGHVFCGAFSPDGAEIATGSGDGTVRLWTADLQLAHGSGVRSVAFSSDGTEILTASWDRYVRLWDRDGRELERFAHVRPLQRAALSPMGDRIATTSTLFRLLRRDGTVVREIPQPSTEVTFSRDGRFVAASDGPVVRIWNADGMPRATLCGHTGNVSGIAFSPDGARIATVCKDRTLRIWNPEQSEGAVCRGHEHAVRHAAFSSDQKRIVTASDDGTARVWTVNGTETLRLRHGDRVLAASFSPSGDRILTAGDDGTARVWSNGGALLQTLGGHAKSVFHAGFSRDGSRIVTAAADGEARIWDRAGEVTRSFRHEGWVTHATFSPRGDGLLTACQDGYARLWSPDGALRVSVHQDWLKHAAFSPKGERFATAGALSSRAGLWWIDGTSAARLPGHAGTVEGIEFSPDGRFVVTASQDRTARIWSLDGTELAVLRGPDAPVLSACFSPDGRFVLTAGADGSARLWHARPDDLVRAAERRAAREFTPEERLRFAELLEE